MTSGDRAPLRTDQRRGSRFSWRWAFVLLSLAVGSAAWAANYVHDRLLELPELRTVKLEHRDLRLTVKVTGTIEPEEIIEVGADVSGKIVEFGPDVERPNKTIDVGSRVSKGSILIQLDREVYGVELQKAQAAWRLAEAEVNRLTAQFKQSMRDLERAQRLRTTNSQSEFDKIETAHEATSAELAVGRARLEQAIATNNQAVINLDRTTIRAPIDGIVIDRRANRGQNIGAGTAGLFLLAKSLDELRIRASVSETDIGKVTVGQPVTFTIDAHRERTMNGHVEKILMNARLYGNFVTYDVLVAIDDPKTGLLPHMTADVELETVKREQAWLVPSSSIGWRPSPELIEPAFAGTNVMESDETERVPNEGDAAVVWVPSGNGRVRPLAVRVGIDDGVLTEVIGEGFREEMPVVVGVVKKTALARIIPSVKTLR